MTVWRENKQYFTTEAPPTSESKNGSVGDLQAVFGKDPLAPADTRCVVSQRLFIHLRYMFETAYGLFLKERPLWVQQEFTFTSLWFS